MRIPFAFILALFIAVSLASQISTVRAEAAEEKGARSSPGALSRFSPGGQYIMLTFSGGPHFKNTPLLLSILKEKRAKATFFVCGAKAQHRPRMLRRMLEEGHELACSGYYPSLQFTKIKQQQQQQQQQMVVNHVLRTAQVITNATSASVKQVRPPAGVTTAIINEEIKASTGMQVILWSLDSMDTAAHMTPDALAARVLRNAQPGDVVQFHDSQNVTLRALPAILDGLFDQGYEMLTIAQVLIFPDDSPH